MTRPKLNHIPQPLQKILRLSGFIPETALQAICLITSFTISTTLLLAYPVNSFAEDKPVGKVIGISGTVEFLAESPPEAKPGEVKKASFEPWKTAKFEQPVFARNQFRTLDGSRLKIIFEDSSLLALGPNSQMSVASYIYKPEEKLRQGAINVAHGLSMYIVNKSQTNKDSSFKLISPTANIAARGTQGYMSVAPDVTYLVNQAGTVITENSNPQVKGQEEVGSMMKNLIAKDQPPSKPIPVTREELIQIRNIVVAKLGLSTDSKGKSPLITVEEKSEKKSDKKGDEPAKDSSKDTSKDTSSSKDTSKDTSKDSPKDAPKDTSKTSTDSTSKTTDTSSTTSGSSTLSPPSTTGTTPPAITTLDPSSITSGTSTTPPTFTTTSPTLSTSSSISTPTTSSFASNFLQVASSTGFTTTSNFSTFNTPLPTNITSGCGR